jgi:hypothetical protein
MIVPELVPTAPRPARAPDAEPETERDARSGASCDFASLLDPRAAAEAAPQPLAGMETAAPPPALTGLPGSNVVPDAEAAEADPEAATDAEAAETARVEAVPLAAPAPPVEPPADDEAPRRGATRASGTSPAGASAQPVTAIGTAVPISPDAENPPAQGAIVPQGRAPAPPAVSEHAPTPTPRPAPTLDPPTAGERAAPGDEPAAPGVGAAGTAAARRAAPRAVDPGATAPEARPGMAVPVVRPAPREDLMLAAVQAGDWRLTAEPAVHRPPAHAPQPFAPVAPQALADQITLAIGRANDRSVEIRLDPPELGRLQIQLNPTEAGLQVLVLAERPETHDLLRRHAELLARDLGGAGFRDVQLDFAAGGQAAPGGRDEARFAASAEAVPSAPVAPDAPPPRRDIAGGLDIRL